MSVDKKIWTELLLLELKGSGKCRIENCDSEHYLEGDPQEGERYAEIILLFLKEFLADNGIDTLLEYNEIKDFI